MKVSWPWRRPRTQPAAQQRQLLTLTDPAFLSIFGLGGVSDAGVTVTEASALGVSAVYRAVSLVSGTLGMLPMRTLIEPMPGQRDRVQSFLDDPGGQYGPTPFEWKETVFLHLLLHGNAFLLHIRGGAGQLVTLIPWHPLFVGVEPRVAWPDGSPVIGGKMFRVTMRDGKVAEHDASTLTHIPGPCTDGVRGLAPITVARHSLGTAIAGDRAAARLFSRGALASYLACPLDDLDREEALDLKQEVDQRVTGWENNGSIPMISRRLDLKALATAAKDAQFLESRAFQVEEVARWFGVPPHLLMQTEKQTSWGTGVETQNRAMSRTVLAPWAVRVEQRLSRLLRGRFVEFDFTGMERPTPEEEINLLVQQVNAGLLTLDEARAIRNLPPVEGGDVIRVNGVPLDQAAALAGPATPAMIDSGVTS